ncbi:MAG: Holliday junction branch migration protein RuvA [Thermoleophilia bacterium]|nr:Holliday junction branch migration protein RuvA [Thermoleophilia bacterium]
MIDRLTGTVLAKSQDGVILDVGGVGFWAEASAITLGDLPPVGERVTIFTHLHVREDALQLYAFSSVEERDVFRLLLGVSKIGPKLALAVLSSWRVQELKRAIAREDVGLLASVPGVGRKTAERLVLELREKIGDFAGREAVPSSVSHPDSSFALARAALVELGYNLQEAERLLATLDHDLPAEDLVRQALAKRV